ncbi:MAG: zinc carboxypeptidase [Bacteroidota bacterium]|nr:zinc carboxypeptidase [Bacteroidota bacterium]
MNKLIVTILSLAICLFTTAQPTYFYPQGGKMNAIIPTPEQFLGYPIGSHHTRHDKLVEYIKELDKLSDRVTVQKVGETYEHRQQIAAIFTSASNHTRLEEIRKTHLAGQLTGATENVPLVIQLGYNVHGNEPSSSEAAMLTAYYLTASEEPETIKWLDQMVMLMDPNINPDGRDRHSNWANMHKASPPVGDPLDREHTEVWPGGRFNHYWFDMNRDWFLAIHPETRNRLRFFHQWRPYVQTDHHEMGSNSTFYFDPGKSSSNNPVVPDDLYNIIYPKFGQYFSEALNKIGSMYFTKEAFDKLYPGYGSSYINFYGGAGFLFEQASSRGHVQETSTIPLTFAFTIRNQFISSLTTIRASLAEKTHLLKMRAAFYRSSAETAKKSPVKAYVFGDANDETRTKAFVDLLLTHQIDVYDVANAAVYNGQRFETAKSFIVPVDQPNYIMIRSVFEKGITYTDSLFYDASTWSLIHAYDLPYAELKTTVPRGKKITSVTQAASPVERSDYAYVFDLRDYNAHKAIYLLQSKGVIVQSAFRPFTATIANTPKSFGYGSVIIPVQLQKISADSIFKIATEAGNSSNVKIYSLGSGYNTGGIDLGSGYVRTLRTPEAMMLVGQGVAPAEAGEIWHLLDQRIGMPITKLDITNFVRANLNRYNTIVMVSGIYTALDKPATDKLKVWLQNGGTLITLKTASEWAIKQGFTKEKLVTPDTTKPKTTPRFNYDDAVSIEGAKALGGSIFAVDLDTTHPVGFGTTNRKISVYKNGQTIFLPSANTYSTVAQYTNNPLIGGYLHAASLKKIKGNAAIVVGAEGSGRVIFFADNPNFRGTWYGTNKLFLNALFFGSHMNVPAVAE